MDPEEAMIEEGRRRVAATAIDNISFVVGGSDDLEKLFPALGEFAAVVISQAFHWMADQDAVLRVLDPLLDRERGAIALVGYVNDPDYNRVPLGLDRPPWDAVERILDRHLAGVPAGPNPAGRHDPFPDILARSPFPRTELLTYQYEALVEPSVDAAIGFHYSLGNLLARLGERRAAFEADVQAAMAIADADTSPLAVRIIDSALIGRRAPAGSGSVESGAGGSAAATFTGRRAPRRRGGCEGVTDEAVYLRSLAGRVVEAARARVAIRAALLAGSAGRGDADRFSDIDLLFYVDEVPSTAAIAEIREAVGGVDPFRRFEATEYVNGEEFRLEGVRTEVSFTDVQRIEWQLDSLLVELDRVASPRQKFLSGLAEGVPLYGEALIEQWQRRLATYPDAFREEMIRRHWNFFPLWYYGEAMSVRDSELWRLDALLDGAFNLLGVLAGLNRLYFARFEFKRMRRFAAKMELAPPALIDRLEELFRLPAAEAAQSFGQLIEETRQLVASELPDLELPLPFPPGTHQQPWRRP